MTPNVDRNKAPETWITAAPQDTLTIRDDTGQPIVPPLTTIPFRYHLYWAGADDDGTVVGFFFAVVETVRVPGLPLPPLPGPKPRDYRFTTKRDSVFIFNVFEATNTRQHAFFIYAVDNQGKADPTPARVIFNSLDRFPPIPVITEATAVGRLIDPNNLRAPPFQVTKAITDTFYPPRQPKDTVAVNSVLTFRWRADLAIADNPAVAYKYQLDEAEFISVPASVTEKRYNSGDSDRVAPGPKIFTLRAIDQAGGARTDPATRRVFIMNLGPDTWFAGPDTCPTGCGPTNFYTEVRYANGQLKERYRELTGSFPWSSVPEFPGSYLHSDSVQVMPAERKPNKTFFELFTEYDFAANRPRHRIYVHGEGDTVHLNSWVLFHTGGFDPDSPYNVRLTVPNPDRLPGIGRDPVLTAGPANGSPIGFKFRIPVFLDSVGPVSTFPQSQTYPLSEAALVPEPHIGGYQGMQLSGRAYAIVRAEDGNGGLDNRIADPVAFVDSIEKNLITPGSPRYKLRDKVLTFYVNRAPYLRLDHPDWQPRQGQNYFTRTIRLRLDLVADDDPFCDRPPCRVGGPEAGAPTPILRFSVVLRGRRTGASHDTTYTPPGLRRTLPPLFPTDIDVPDFIAGPDVTVEIELCDCVDCELVPGQGRCRRYPPIRVTVPVAAEPPASSSSVKDPSGGPGFSGAVRGSKTP